MVSQRDQIAALRDQLAAQLEEVFHVRRTEAEEALAEYKEHFEESMKRKEDLIQELTTHTTKLQGPAHSNQSSTLQFITREQADEEKRALQEESDRYKELIKQRDARLQEKDQRINALQAEISTVSKERDAEIERSKTIANRSGPAASGLSRPTSLETQNASVIRLYEDMTNILVTNLKYEKSDKWPELEEELATCVYTYTSGEDDSTWSLHFTLRLIYDLPEGVTATGPVAQSELVQKMMYQPKDLDHEPPEYAARLGFFKSAFMFSRGQMSVFIRTLGESVANIFDGEEAGGTTEILMDGSA
ncbi:hypothetical protein C8Q80DRAFT_753382 [Daedaleopsis nitida]|nr:hypothetical protein C8Q80DRAFT_753382 [Daedaleopsis nitida]